MINNAALFAKDLPWNCFRPEDLGPVVMNFVNDHEPFFRRWAQIWYENFQFLYGNHNIKWSRKYGFAVDYDFLRTSGPFSMRAQTNIARVICEALASFIYGNVPDWEVETMDESSTRGKRFRKIVQKMLEAYMERLVLQKDFKAAAMIYALFGQVGFDVDWDPMAGQLLELPRYQKIQAPVFSTYMAPNQMTGGLIEVPTQMVDSGGQPLFEQRWEEVLDQQGRQIIDKLFAGDVRVQALTPFEYRREMGQYGMHKTRYVQRFKLMDYDEFIDQYQKVGGQTPEFAKVRPVYSDPMVYNMALRHFMRMQFTAPPSLDDGFGRTQNVFKSSLFKYKVFVVEHWDKPHDKKWPQGRRVVVANGSCTHITAPNYNTNKVDGWHQLLEAQWLVAPPNSIAAGPLNDVIRKNKELDVKDSIIATSVRRNMGAPLLVDINSGIDPQRLSGEPGIALEVNDIMGARYLHDEIPIPPVITRLRELDKEDIYESSGALEALRGEKSAGSSSGYQEKQREEREEKRLSPARHEFENAVSGVGEKMFACLKANVRKLDDYVMGFLKRSAAGEYTTQDVIAVLTSTVDYGVDIKVVRSSMAIKSKATQQATLQELAKGVLAQRLGQDARVLDEYLKYFDIETLRDDSAPHRDRAGQENEVFMDMLRLGPNTEGIAKPLVLFEDDDAIHLAEHTRNWVQNFNEFRNNEAFMLEYIAHMEHHRIQQGEKQAQYPPGTATQTDAMVAQARGASLPTPQQVFVGTQQRQMQQQQQQAQAQGGQTLPNPAPRQTSQGGPGPGKLDPRAPSQNTPAGQKQSVAMQGGT